jgi:diguanylate cyclase (GGDEF)-like protein
VEPATQRQGLPADVRRRSGSTERDAALVEAVLDAVPFPTVLLDPDGLMLLGNQAWNEGGSVRHDNRFRPGVGHSYYAESLAVQDDEGVRGLVRCLRELAEGRRGDVSLDHAVGRAPDTRWFHIHASRVDQAGHVVVSHVDISARVAAEQTATWRARHDHLTGLPNRSHLHELVDRELDSGGGPLAVLFLDVDGFKDVNDTLGHDVGDELLRELAARLTGATRAEDTVGRLGGDEFVVLCRDCDAEGAERLARRFAASFERPFLLAGRSVRLSASIGIAGVAGDRRRQVRSTDLVRDADLAMYAAKAAGRNRVHAFTPDLLAAAEQKVTLAAELGEAIERDQLVLHYQPIMHLPSRRCTGFEALVRWQHPERGLLYPGEFLPTAEQADLMVPLARWVLGAVTRQNAAWRAAGLDLVTGVNIDAQHFATGTLVTDVMAALTAADLPAEHLVIELTETSVAEDPCAAAAQFAELRRRGVEVSIDDFGSGFSSLSQLVTIPAGVLKIDRSLVAFGDGTRERAAATIAAVVALGRACGIRSLAEGVETAEQLELAAELGCTFAQGYHIARPMPADQVAPWMAADVTSAAAR